MSITEGPHPYINSERNDYDMDEIREHAINANGNTVLRRETTVSDLEIDDTYSPSLVRGFLFEIEEIHWKGDIYSIELSRYIHENWDKVPKLGNVSDEEYDFFYGDIKEYFDLVISSVKLL